MAGWKKEGPSGRGADYIKCPFYRAHSSRSILCQSHVPDSRIELKFDSEKKKNIQQHVFCEGLYDRCEHYRAVLHFAWPEE